MPPFVIRPLSRDVTIHVRTTLLAPQYGHPVHRELARGTGPCRECLAPFDVGNEDRLLFTHNPFEAALHIPQPGPVFIHADTCEPFAGADYPEGLKGLPVLAEAYHSDGTRSAPSAVAPGDEAATLSALLDTPTVGFLHLRHAEAGCFIARVDRVGA